MSGLSYSVHPLHHEIVSWGWPLDFQNILFTVYDPYARHGIKRTISLKNVPSVEQMVNVHINNFVQLGQYSLLLLSVCAFVTFLLDVPKKLMEHRRLPLSSQQIIKVGSKLYSNTWAHLMKRTSLVSHWSLFCNTSWNLVSNAKWLGFYF